MNLKQWLLRKYQRTRNPLFTIWSWGHMVLLIMYWSLHLYPELDEESQYLGVPYQLEVWHPRCVCENWKGYLVKHNCIN